MPSTAPVVIRYGANGTGVLSQHDGATRVDCNNHLGDFNRGAQKTCEFRNLPAAEHPPRSGYRQCATVHQDCNSGATPDRPVWIRYGAGSTWSYGLASGTVKCDWNIAGDAVKYAGLPAVCEIGPAYDKLSSGTTWSNCASEGNQCTIAGGGDAVKLMRYGAGNRFAYKFVDTAATKMTMLCINDAFNKDPAHGATKFCQIAVPPAGSSVAIQSIRGTWAPVASCTGSGCVASRAVTVGVQSSTSNSKTKDWSQAVMIGIEKQFGVPTAAQSTVTVQSTTTFGGSSQVQSAMQRSSTGTNTLQCGPTPAGRLSTQVYQYQIEVQERCAEQGMCASTIMTTEIACIADPPSPTFKPACQPGCFANDLGTLCKQVPACTQMVHPEFASVQRPASAAQPTPQPAPAQPATTAVAQPSTPQPQPAQQATGLEGLDYPPDWQAYIDDMRSQGIPEAEIREVIAFELQALSQPNGLNYPPEWQGWIEDLRAQGYADDQIQSLVNDELAKQ